MGETYVSTSSVRSEGEMERRGRSSLDLDLNVSNVGLDDVEEEEELEFNCSSNKAIFHYSIHQLTCIHRRVAERAGKEKRSGLT